MSDFKFELGVRVKDTVTGFKGIIDYRVAFLTGCNRYSVQPTGLGKDGQILKSETFDENRLRSVSGKTIKISETASEKLNGGVGPVISKPDV